MLIARQIQLPSIWNCFQSASELILLNYKWDDFQNQVNFFVYAYSQYICVHLRAEYTLTFLQKMHENFWYVSLVFILNCEFVSISSFWCKLILKSLGIICDRCTLFSCKRWFLPLWVLSFEYCFTAGRGSRSEMSELYCCGMTEHQLNLDQFGMLFVCLV